MILSGISGWCPNCKASIQKLYLYKQLTRCGACFVCPVHKSYKAIRRPKASGCKYCEIKWRLVHGRF